MLGGQGVVTATWTTLLNAPPEGLQLCLLLTDASLLCQATQNWYRLTPSLTGSYIDGTWTLFTNFPATYIPEAFASAVLADGRVAIMGGENTPVNGSFSLHRDDRQSEEVVQLLNRNQLASDWSGEDAPC